MRGNDDPVSVQDEKAGRFTRIFLVQSYTQLMAQSPALEYDFLPLVRPPAAPPRKEGMSDFLMKVGITLGLGGMGVFFFFLSPLWGPIKRMFPPYPPPPPPRGPGGGFFSPPARPRGGEKR